MIRIPLSSIKCTPAEFAAALEDHRAAVEAHMMGEPGPAAPVAGDLAMGLILRVPDAGPVAERGPDRIMVGDYEIFDDTPASPVEPDTQRALDVLRDTISG